MQRLSFSFGILFLLASAGLAENGAEGWLRYARLDAATASKYSSLPEVVIVLNNSLLVKTAQAELLRGVHGMLDRTLRVSGGVPRNAAIVVGTVNQVRGLEAGFKPGANLRGDAYALICARLGGQKALVITGATDRGVLYGTFTLLSKIARGESVTALNELQKPSAPVRWVNQWDNLDGSIERGYAGRSIFFENRHVRADLTRAAEYARLLASVGINGCNVSNVNADLHILDSDFLPQLARIANVFRPYGIQLGVAVNVSMPKQVGGLDTFDPLDPRVADWWRAKFSEVYREIPDFGGVVVKADSEGQLGPSVYGRSPTGAANAIARALKPHGGMVFYRAFVYSHHLDWSDLKADRARAAYDIFHPLDGKFDDNVIVQIKYGPIDFQVREPASPLFGGLEKTNEAIELQITQEYTGQQRHTVFLVPMWKEILDFDMGVNGQHTPVKDIVAGRSFHRTAGGYVGVANVGLSTNWLANHLAMANLYGFGRLAWNPNLSSQAIAEEWTKLTLGDDPDVVRKATEIQLASWPAYESYTGVLGLQTLTNITGSHYGPAPESQERNGWGQWIRADCDAVGMDRTIATGTGFIGQYSPMVQKIYESLANTPDELVLFFHHVPYTYKLHSGKTVIQTIYDGHYEGASKAHDFVTIWKSLKGRLDYERFDEVLAQLEYQSGHAIVWRDAINDWFHRISGIADEKGRVAHHPNRVEAEAMELKGYESFEPASWEGASGGAGVLCPASAQSCSAQTRFQGALGRYELDVEYFDVSTGVSQFNVFVGDRVVDRWRADDVLPGRAPSADSSVRRRINGLELHPGDVIRIEGVPDQQDRAPLDYIEVIPAVQLGDMPLRPWISP
ncbi:MAG TPA: alpha-glucuronidase family glycosyl hydrolase [Terriglobales bacterium]|nr:alpha-glucuronidase family glycosyl hydrolase [Terriglobales bacterium]